MNMSQTEDTGTQSVQGADPDDVVERGTGAMLFTLALLLFGIVILVQSMGIRSQAQHWPRILSIGLIAVTALRLIIDGYSLWRARQAQPSAGRWTFAMPGTAAMRQIFTALWMITFVLVAPLVGFGFAALVLMPVYMWVYGFRRPVWIIVTTALSVGAFSLLFDTVANVPMWSNRL